MIRGLVLSAVFATAVSTNVALAKDYLVGISAGLTGYAATVDRAWRDGVELAADVINARGGILGQKVQVVVEDNRSDPQQAVTVYRKMLSSDSVQVFASGCVSAGNFAAAPLLVRSKVPAVLCSILPTQPDSLKWTFTTLPPARYEVEKRLEYLQSKTQIRKIGVLHDPTPYSNLQASVAEKIASSYGMEIVGNEQYGQEDADLSPELSKMKAAGAGAILKIGLGGTTLTAAKNIKQLGIDLVLLTSLEDLAVFRPVADVLGDRFLFVASPSQVFDALKDGPLKTEIKTFLDPWRSKYGDRDPNWASRGWDALMLIATVANVTKDLDGSKMREGIEDTKAFQGTTATYSFSASDHQGIEKNPFFLATIRNGKVEIVQ